METIPGWAHNIKNIGKDELIVMLWANELFDKKILIHTTMTFKINLK